MDNFLSGGSQPFGIQQASVISGDAADLIFGNASPSVDPSKVTPVKKVVNKKPVIKAIENDEDEDEYLDPDSHVNREPAALENKFTADDILNAAPGEDDDENHDAPPKPAPKAQPEPEADDNQQDAESAFSDMTKELIKLGIFKERDEDSTAPIKTGEGLRDRFIKEAQEKANGDIYNFIMSKHGEEGVEAFDAIFVKGIPPKDYLSKFVELQTFESLDMSVEDNQKTIFREAYRRQGLAEDKIEKKLQRTIDYGDLEEESKDLHEIVLKQDREDMNLKLAEAQEQEENKRVQRSEYLNNMNLILGNKLKEKEFDGIPLTEKVAREAFDYLTSEKWILPSGEKITDFDKDVLELRDPKNHELRVKMALLLRSKLDLTKIKTKAITTETNRVFDGLVKRDAQIRRVQKTSLPSTSFLDNL